MIFQRLWQDQIGAVISAELVLVATILVIGMIVGLTTVRDQVVQELADVAAAVSDISQSYDYTGVTGHTSHTAGSDFHDKTDNCDVAGEQDGDSACVTVLTAPEEEWGD